MAIVKIIKRENPYILIDKTGINDSRLSWGASGLLTYLIGKPADWKINLKHLSTVKEKDKKDKTRGYLNELREFEYCHYFEIRKQGRVTETFYLVFEVPIKSEEILLDNYIKTPEGYTILHKKIFIKENNNKKEKSFDRTEVSPKLENQISVSSISANQTLLIKECSKERVTNNRITTNDISDNKKVIKEKTNSTSYTFLNLKKYELLNFATKINIQNHIKNLKEEEFEKIYNLTSEYINSGKGNNFNAILYKGLLGEWNFDPIITEKTKVEAKKELDIEKRKWLSYFAGIVTDKSLKADIESIIIDIPLDILVKNKRRLAMMSMFEFKQCLLSLKRSC